MEENCFDLFVAIPQLVLNDALQEDPYTLTIDGDEAVVVGLSELGTDPLKLQFENGELYWVPPEKDVRVFTLRLLEDGTVTLSFDTIPEAPVFHFDPIESRQ